VCSWLYLVCFLDFFFIISILTIILLFLSASVSRIVFYVVIVFCAAIVRNKLLKDCLTNRRTCVSGSGKFGGSPTRNSRTLGVLGSSHQNLSWLKIFYSKLKVCYWPSIVRVTTTFLLFNAADMWSSAVCLVIHTTGTLTVRDSSLTLTQFCTRLKTFLFTRAYGTSP